MPPSVAADTDPADCSPLDSVDAIAHHLTHAATSVVDYGHLRACIDKHLCKATKGSSDDDDVCRLQQYAALCCLRAKLWDDVPLYANALLDNGHATGAVRLGDMYFGKSMYESAALYYWRCIMMISNSSANDEVKMEAYCVTRLQKLHGKVSVRLHCIDAGLRQRVLGTKSIDQSTYMRIMRSFASVENVEEMNPSVRKMMYTINNQEGAKYAMPRNLSWFIPGVLMGSSTPRSARDIELLQQVYDIRVVVTVTQEEPLPATWFTDEIRNVFLPTPPGEAPTVKQVDEFLNLMEESGGPVLIHCGGGKGRAGTFLACYAVRFGLNPPTDSKWCTTVMSACDGISLIRNMRPGSLETDVQEAFVRHYAQHLWARVSYAEPIVEPISSPEWHVTGAFHKQLQGKKPSFIMCVGLPGSGKSWFADMLEKRGGYARVCQDECDGSRDIVENTLGKQITKGKVVLDRCNPTKADRAHFLGLAFKPSNALAVHFSAPPDLCKQRIVARTNHPTITSAHQGARAVDSFAACLVPPTTDEGFAAVCTVSSFTAAVELLAFLKIKSSTNNDDGETAADVVRSPSLTDDSSDSMKEAKTTPDSMPPPVRPPAKSSSSKPNALVKFPRTQHLIDLGGSGVTRDDLVLRPQDLTRFFAPGGDMDVVVTVEEKVDGANMGLGYSAEFGTIVAQNRSHYVNCKTHAQFAKLNFWLEQHMEELFTLVTEVDAEGNATPKRILYGEWMFAKHSIYYDLLPDYFIAFDLYDIDAGRFYSRKRFHALLEELAPGISKVPSVEANVEDLKATCLALKSAFRSNAQNAEGVYVRVDVGDWLKDRGKVVRPDFICGDQHWTKAEITKNELDYTKQHYG
eukprot:GEMP01011156.1.p1 GENE.GEMP01011156.1~~GEMP01011156.1.p1  ORF type:complete len:876 (+),score=192.79 GEMP01011156.1:59-2629(+)